MDGSRINFRAGFHSQEWYVSRIVKLSIVLTCYIEFKLYIKTACKKVYITIIEETDEAGELKVSILEITLNVEKNGVMSNFELNIFKALKIIRTSPPLKKKSQIRVVR